MNVQEIGKKREIPVCGYCGNATDQKIIKCNICKKVYYCNAFCQKDGWKKHKKVCEKYQCNSCHTTAKKLKKCTGCLKVFYCSEKCQKKDWKEHKKICERKLTQKENIFVTDDQLDSAENLEAALNEILLKSEKEEEMSEKKPELDEETAFKKALSTCWGCKKTDVKVYECQTCRFAQYCTDKCKNDDAKIHNQICSKWGQNFVYRDVDREEKSILVYNARKLQEKLTDEDLQKIKNSPEPTLPQTPEQLWASVDRVAEWLARRR